MSFITLTTVFSTKKIMVNPRALAVVMSLPKTGSSIGLVGSMDSSYIHVSESVDEIAALILQAEKA